MKNLSIIVPCYNKWNYTAHTIKSLLLLDQKQDIEIIIADDGSTDETQSAIEHYLSDDRLIYSRSENNQLFAANCNRAYAKSKGDVVLFLNNDIKIQTQVKNWIDIVINAANEQTNAIMGPLGGYLDPKNNFIFAYETGDKNRLINYISGFCLFAKRNVLDKLIISNYLGPFSEEFGMYYEDSDLGFRANKMGHPLKIIDLPIQHIGKVSTSQMNTYKLYNEARQIFVKKWKR